MAGIPTSPIALEVWFNNLTPAAQTKLIKQTQTVYRSLPVPLQRVLQRHMISIGENPPIAPLDGFGAVGTAGLGQWAALAMSLAQMGTQIGTQLYNTKEQNSLQQELQSNALSSNAAIVSAQNAASLQAQQILADAQVATANAAAAAISAQSSASLFGGMSTTTKAGLVVGGIAAVGFVAFLALRKKHR